MGCQVAGDSNENVPARIGVAPLPELSHTGLEHLVGVKTCIFAQQRPSKRGDQGLRWIAQREMAGDQAGGRIDLPLAIKGVKQSSMDRLGIGWEVLQPITFFAG